MAQHDTAAIVRDYFHSWTTKDFSRATALLSSRLTVEVPVNDYPTTESFATALAGFGSLAQGVTLLAEMSAGDEAMLLYDMDVPILGTLRVAEHFTVADGEITRIRQVHDTAAIREAGLAGQSPSPGYARRLTIQAAREHVFGLIATVDGPRRWWTTIVSGSAEPGGELGFGFAGLDEGIVMHVDVVQPPSAVQWSCVRHTRGDEWTGSTLRFELTGRGPRACELNFRHVGLPAELVANGWEHFLGSLAACAEQGSGAPFGA